MPSHLPIIEWYKEAHTSLPNYFSPLEELKSGHLHLITFAEGGFSAFAFILKFSNFCKDINQIQNYVDQINKADESTTLYPKLNLTVIPQRFARKILATEQEITDFRNCIKDCFKANREYIKAETMFFDWSCAACNRELLVKIIKEIARNKDLEYCKKVMILTAKSELEH